MGLLEIPINPWPSVGKGVVVGRLRFDWRWVALIAFVALLANAGRLPWQVLALALGAAGAYILVIGWRAWTRPGSALSRGRVTYWRGQRIETPPRRGVAMPRLADIGSAAIYFLIGGALVLAAVAIILNNLGI
jgi:hypothetical protein